MVTPGNRGEIRPDLNPVDTGEVSTIPDGLALDTPSAVTKPMTAAEVQRLRAEVATLEWTSRLLVPGVIKYQDTILGS